MIKLDLQLFGGRGSGSYTAGGVIIGMGGGGGGNSSDLNIAGWTPDAGNRFVDKANTVKGIKSKIQDLDHEQMAIVDKYGYVVAAVDGGQSSVGITPNAAKYIKGNDVYHNHPNGGALSTEDVITLGQTGSRSITAFSKNQKKGYTLTATSKADGTGLSQAMQKAEKGLLAKWQAKADSMKGKKYTSEASYKKQLNAHWDNILGDWMNTNASKYGYSYSVTKG